MKRITMLAAVPVSIAAVVGGAPAAGAAPARAALNCQVGLGVEKTTFTSPTTSAGHITGSRLITGTTAFVITSADASGDYTGVLSISTSTGTLTTKDTGVLRSDGTFTEIGQVNGSSSTGQFNGALGGIVIDGRTDPNNPAAFTAAVAAAVCLR